MHPLDPSAGDNEGLRKAIVLLSDGVDNYCGSLPGACIDSNLGIDRSEACSLAKKAGHEIFVAAAMPPKDVSSELAPSLRDCPTEADNSGGTCVFINNEDEKSPHASFLIFANQLQQVRQVLWFGPPLLGRALASRPR